MRHAAWPSGDYVETGPIIGADGAIYVGSDDRVYAISPANVRIWTRAISSHPHSNIALDPAGNLWLGWNQSLLNLSRVNGTTIRSINMGDQVRSGPAITANGILFVGDDSRRFRAFDTTTGAQLWARTLADDIRSSPAIDLDGRVYFGDMDGYFYAFE